MPYTQHPPFASPTLAACIRAGASLAVALAVLASSAPLSPAAADATVRLAQAAGAAVAAPGKPPSAPEREAAYLARMDKIVSPLLDYPLADEDIAKLKAAFKAAGGDAAQAKQIEASITDPVARRLVQWLRLTRGKGEAAEYLKFLADNPRWPSREAMQRRMEEVLLDEGGDTDALAAYFKDGEARSPAGMAVLASMHLAHGEKEEAKALAAKLWREKDLAADLEKGFLARFGSMLTVEDHKWRLNRLLVDDARYKAEREARAAQAKRVIALLPAADQKTAQARLAVFMHAKGGKKANLDATGKGGGTDWGVTFHKIQQKRRAGKLDEAAKLMRTAPLDPGLVANLDDWWTERRSLAYLALKQKQPKLAYEIVRDAGPIGANALNDQTFMAGWIALRYLNDVKGAEKHFADLLRTADGPQSRARGNYWMGRTAEALGDMARARASYTAAAREVDTFHGLLAMQKLNPGRQPLSFDLPAAPDADAASRFADDDTAKAFAIARKAALGRSVTRVFLLNLRKIDKSEAWAAMAAHLAAASGDTQTAVRIGKWAIADGNNLIYYSYPVHALPKYEPLRPPPETAFLLGLARQETEFDSDTVSGAGARGILQVMKVTANHICRDYKIKCKHDRLLTDDGYNIMIASAYVADRMQEWDGSYVLGLSSYNAGPGRTREWIAEFGDPRQPDVDPIDWIERIPFEETRRYVAKVLSNIQVYRARLGEQAALRLDEDLNRARVGSTPGDAARKASTAN